MCFIKKMVDLPSCLRRILSPKEYNDICSNHGLELLLEMWNGNSIIIPYERSNEPYFSLASHFSAFLGRDTVCIYPTKQSFKTALAFHFHCRFCLQYGIHADRNTISKEEYYADFDHLMFCIAGDLYFTKNEAFRDVVNDYVSIYMWGKNYFAEIFSQTNDPTPFQPLSGKQIVVQEFPNPFPIEYSWSQ